jgi:cytochrome c
MLAFTPLVRKVVPFMGVALLLTACGGGDSASDDAALKAKVASLPAPYNTGDYDNGKVMFAQCRSCHTVVQDGANMVGPNLYGMFGQKAGTKAGFEYSTALKSAGFIWDAQHLNDWVAQPQTYLPGTKMTFPGLNAEKDRVDLIAYLKIESGYAK